MVFRPLDMSDYSKKDGSQAGFDYKKKGNFNTKIGRAKHLLGTNFNQYELGGIFDELEAEEKENLLDDLEQRLSGATTAVEKGRICEEWLVEAKEKASKPRGHS